MYTNGYTNWCIGHLSYIYKYNVFGHHVFHVLCAQLNGCCRAITRRAAVRGATVAMAWSNQFADITEGGTGATVVTLK